jgi:hypothetical protein
MTHDELLARLKYPETILEKYEYLQTGNLNKHEMLKILRAVVELHRPIIHALPDETCWACQDLYPCPTIQAIEKELG